MMAVHPIDLKLSRRGLLRRAGLASCAGALMGAGLAAGRAEAAGKLSQKASGYRATPKGKAECDNCSQWQPPAGCKIVDGVISATGWCNVYTLKS